MATSVEPVWDGDRSREEKRELLERLLDRWRQGDAEAQVGGVQVAPVDTSCSCWTCRGEACFSCFFFSPFLFRN